MRRTRLPLLAVLLSALALTRAIDTGESWRIAATVVGTLVFVGLAIASRLRRDPTLKWGLNPVG